MSKPFYSAFRGVSTNDSRVRSALLVLALSVSSSVSAAEDAPAAPAEPTVAQTGDGPNFSGGGFTFSIQYGPGLWNMSRAQLESQASALDADLFITELQSTHTASLRMAYNIKGHVSIGVDFTATGWRLFEPTRGGAGFLVGSLAWHPLELVFMKKDRRPVALDVALMLGLGYGIGGQGNDPTGQNGRGADGAVFQTSLLADYFFTKYFGLGIAVRTNWMLWDKFYRDYQNKDLPGNTVDLPKGSGGQFFHFALTLTFRAGE